MDRIHRENIAPSARVILEIGRSFWSIEKANRKIAEATAAA